MFSFKNICVAYWHFLFICKDWSLKSPLAFYRNISSTSGDKVVVVADGGSCEIKVSFSKLYLRIWKRWAFPFRTESKQATFHELHRVNQDATATQTVREATLNLGYIRRIEKVAGVVCGSTSLPAGRLVQSRVMAPFARWVCALLVLLCQYQPASSQVSTCKFVNEGHTGWSHDQMKYCLVSWGAEKNN